MTDQELKQALAAAEKGPQKLAAAVSGLSDQTLRYKPSPAKWCILEIIGHLADVELVYGHRLRQMLADKKPVIAPIDQDDWARHLGYLEASPAELVAQYGLNRHHNLRLLKRIDLEDLKKSAYHPERRAEVTVEELVARLAQHDANHIAQIARLKQQASAHP
ncbi:MAG: DinB family protein [Acidobacteria bacterium]|nr:DinB family protein [Acidobacteriota bacterium]MBV8892925.1 DinB family protein [Acidobacteriota bacterium]MBV9480205.1 DinB family protein [Acidobacteriota bacterium]